MTWLVALLLLLPSLALAQGTTNSRTQDGTGNQIPSSTSAPVGTERGLITRPIPSGTQDVRLTDGTHPVNVDLLSNEPTDSEYGLTTRSVIHGHTTAGGGSYVDVKVNPSGALTVEATQAGTWSAGRTWTLGSGTDSVSAVQSGAWSTGRTWSLASGTDSVAAVQSGAWSTGRTWTLSSGADSVSIVGVVTVDGSNFIQPVAESASSVLAGFLQSGATGNGNGSLATVDGYLTMSLVVTCSACSGGTTVFFEATEDGSNFHPVWLFDWANLTPATSTSTAGLTYWVGPIAGISGFRARIGGYSAGTITVTSRAAPTPFVPLQPVAQPPVPITSTVTEVTAAWSGSVTLLSANTSRRGVLIQNTCQAPLLVKLGVGAKQNSFTVAIPANGAWAPPNAINYQGQIDAKFPQDVCSALVTELAG